SRHRGKRGPCRRSRLPHADRGRAQPPARKDRSAPCRRGACRHDRLAGDRCVKVGLSVMAEATLSFKKAAEKALADGELQRALQNVKTGFVAKRAVARAKLPEFDTLRTEARAIKDHTLTHLDLYLEAYESTVVKSGGQVHFASTAADARDIVLKLCRERGAKLVAKGKSMVSEEIGLTAHLETAGIEGV